MAYIHCAFSLNQFSHMGCCNGVSAESGDCRYRAAGSYRCIRPSAQRRRICDRHKLSSVCEAIGRLIMEKL